jgi:hypothetical protein
LNARIASVNLPEVFLPTFLCDRDGAAQESAPRDPEAGREEVPPEAGMKKTPWILGVVALAKECFLEGGRADKNGAAALFEKYRMEGKQ